MNVSAGLLLTLAIQFGMLSFLAIGGGISAVPEMHRQAVEVQHWMTDRQFADLFTISQAAPGPNFLLVTLVGYFTAGISGALVATLAMCGPSCFIAYFVAKAWDRFKGARWREAIQSGMVPVSIGLIGSVAFILARTADTSAVAIGLTLATAYMTLMTKVSPLWLFAVAGILCFAGWV
jgi:chromate transporter